MQIRDLDLERDAHDLAALVREINPSAVVDARAVVHRHRTIPARAEPRTVVADVDGAVVGRVVCFRNFFTVGSETAICDIAVAARHRRRGIGTALYDAGVVHADRLDAVRLLTSFHENEDGVRFARARGFRQVRAETEAVLDPREVTERPPAHVDLRAVRAVDPRLVHEVDEAATRDVPQTEGVDEIPYDEWVAHVLEHPMFTSEGSFVAIVDGVAAAVSLLLADLETGRAHNMFTGTLREHRGRGLALAVKLASIEWAAANGVTQMWTTNDETNAPMLAVNRRLGYRPAGRRVEYVLERERLARERDDDL